MAGLPVQNINDTVGTAGEIAVAAPAAGRRYSVLFTAEDGDVRLGGPTTSSTSGVKIASGATVLARMGPDVPLYVAAVSGTVAYSAAVFID